MKKRIVSIVNSSSTIETNNNSKTETSFNQRNAAKHNIQKGKNGIIFANSPK